MDQNQDTEDGFQDKQDQTDACKPENKVKPHSAEPNPGPAFGHGQAPEPAPGHGSSCSVKDDSSMSEPYHFEGEQQCDKQSDVFSSLQSRSAESMILIHTDVKHRKHPSDERVHQRVRDIDSIFMLLEEEIISFIKNELKKMHHICISPDYPDYSENRHENEEQKNSRDAFQKITLSFLRMMKQGEVADLLRSKTGLPLCQHKLKSNLKKKYQCVFEGITKERSPTLLNQVYTELYTTKEQSVAATVTCKDMFKDSTDRCEPIRTVLTKGVAGIGKSVLTQKFSLDWAEDKANQDIHFTFPFTFRELNVLKEKRFSLVELVHHFFSETKEAGICSFEEFQVLFIFDGLDECRPPLDFNNTQTLTDITESTSVDVLLMNLIRGKLLPSARLWITTQPAAASQIPAECVDMVTEVRGFTDLQKEEYFRKRFKDVEQANTIISHIKTSRSLYSMCRIPVFSWITAEVLENMLKTTEGGELPKTQTEMYIHFLLIQTKRKNIAKADTEQHFRAETRKVIESLGKLAFEQLQKGNLIFYESDLTECSIDIRTMSLCSGVLTEISRRGLHQDKSFCFVHLSVQEFLAAHHVHQTFINTGVNLLSEETLWSKLLRREHKLAHLHQAAVDKALLSPNGHLDLFLRFLLGLSLPTNQRLIRHLLTQTGSNTEITQETVQHIKKKISKDLSVERSINLFHCLNELNDSSLVDQIQQYLSLGCLSTDKLYPEQWSALAFILLTSEDHLDVFDLKKYCASEEALQRLLPVVKASSKATLSSCNLLERSCEAVSSVLSSKLSSLRELDLSNNDLQDSGVKLLCSGLKNPNCTLEAIRLSGCLITEEGCAALASALRANHSHLRDLDLSYNHPGGSGQRLLLAGVENPQWKLDTLRLDPAGQQWLKPGLRKYFCELTLDTNTASRNLKLSDNNRTVKWKWELQTYPDHPERFDWFYQLLSTTALIGRCYFEVKWSGWVNVALAYRGIRRRGVSNDCVFGANQQSWSLTCSDKGYTIWHSNRKITLAPSASSNRVGVYVDCPSGSLSFYRVSSDKLIHLHTFSTTFTEPLYAGFGFRNLSGSSVSLCPL